MCMHDNLSAGHILKGHLDCVSNLSVYHGTQYPEMLLSLGPRFPSDTLVYSRHKTFLYLQPVRSRPLRENVAASLRTKREVKSDSEPGVV